MKTLQHARRGVRTAVRAVACAVAVVAAAGCGDSASTAECEKLLDHLIDIQIKESGGDAELTPEAKDELAKQKAKVVEFSKDQGFIKTCTQKTPRKVVECGLAAKTSADVAKCDEGR